MVGCSLIRAGRRRDDVHVSIRKSIFPIFIGILRITLRKEMYRDYDR